MVVFLVLLGVLVCLNEHELESAKEESASKKEVLLNVILLVDRVMVLLAFHELATNASRILIAHLVDLDGVVAAVE